MNKFAIIAVIFAFVVTLGVLNISDSFAQSSEISELISDIPDNLITPDLLSTISPIDGIIRESKLVNVDATIFESDKIRVTTFGESTVLTNSFYEIKENGDVYWGGENKDGYYSIFIINEDTVFGNIATEKSHYKISYSGIGDIHVLEDHDVSKLPSEHGDNNSMDSIAGFGNLPQELQDQITLLSDSYIGGYDYTENTVTITLVVGYTTEADNQNSNIENMIISAVNQANRSYERHDLPIVLDLVDNGEVRGYTEAGMRNDITNLLNPDMNDLDGLRGQGLRDDADIVILVTHYPSMQNDPNGCGVAGDILVDNIDESVAIVRDVCLEDNHSLAHEIGHLQGAQHDEYADPVARAFDYAHGYLSQPAGQRTIMAYPNDAICDPNNQGFECSRVDLWSDPNVVFFGATLEVAGVEATNFNAKALFATAPYISSLRGAAQNYDVDPPEGYFEWIGILINKIFTPGEILDITATFDEPLSDSYPPYVTISDGTTTTVSEMIKSTETVYTNSHILTTEIGTVSMEFSNARDVYGNEIIVTPTRPNTFQVVALDTTDPIIILNNPISMTIEVGSSFTDPGYLATDDRDGNITSNVLVTGTVDTNTIGTYYLNYNVSDTSGNAAITVTRTVNVVDTTSPSFTFVPSDQTFEATAVNTPLTSTQIGVATATDNYDLNPTITRNPTLDYFPLGDTTITWTAIDTSGNSNSATHSVTIEDNTEPAITAPADISQDEGIPVTLGNAVASDIFLDTVTNDSTGIFPVGDTIVTWTATDTSGNSNSATQRVTIIDITDPSFTFVPSDQTFEATAVNTPLLESDYGTATATDDTDPNPTVTNNAPSTFPLGDTPITWTATDTSGNSNSATHSVTIEDNTEPAITAPADISQDEGIPVTLGNAVASDIFLDTVTNDSTGIFPVGDTIVTWTATDTSGNSNSATQRVTIIGLSDITAPLITLNGNSPITLAVDDSYTDAGATCTDDVDGTLSVTVGGSVDTTTAGTYSITYDCTDSSNNPADTVTRIVNVLEPIDVDPNAPVLLETKLGNSKTLSLTFDKPVTFTDNSGFILVTNIGNINNVRNIEIDSTISEKINLSLRFSITTRNVVDNFTTVYYDDTLGNLQDHAGNKVQSFKAVQQLNEVFVVSAWIPTDVRLPVISLNGDNPQFITFGSSYADLGATCADNIDNDAQISQSASTVDVNITGMYTVTYDCTDSSGNNAIQSIRTVIVAHEAGTTSDVTPAVPIDVQPGSNYKILALTFDEPVIFADSSGFTLVANNGKANRINDINLGTNSEIINLSLYFPLYHKDIVDKFSTLYYDDTLGNLQDHAGNKVQSFEAVQQLDDVFVISPPLILAPVDQTFEATAISTPLDSSDYGTPTTTDINVTITNNAPVDFPLGDTIIIWSATDSDGNVFTATQTITIVDTTPPVITAPLDQTFEAIAINTPRDNSHYGTATATDIFGVTITNNAPATFPLGDTIITWSATDSNGYVETATQTITIVDTTEPIITVPSTHAVLVDITEIPLSLDSSDYGTATATDIFNVTITNNAPTTFPAGDTIITWTATDSNGNVSTATQLVTIITIQKIVPSNSDSHKFGDSVSISGNTVIVGATESTGLNPGSAYIFEKVDSWIETQQILLDIHNHFGESVSISGNTAIVGDGDGFAYIFEKVGSSWVETQKLVSSDDEYSFGNFVAISGNTIIVGARFHDDNGSRSGSAYIFEKVGSSWVETQKLLASDGAAGDWFGESVSIDGNIAIVSGAYHDDNGSNSGSAYIFEKVGSSWVETQKLVSSDGAEYDNFGYSVFLDGNTAIVGAMGDNNNGSNSGSVYIFEKVGSSWVETQKIVPSNGAIDDRFGFSVARDGNTAIVGSYIRNDVAYIFEKVGDSWVELVLPATGVHTTHFGYSVAIDGNTAIVGSYHDAYLYSGNFAEFSTLTNTPLNSVTNNVQVDTIPAKQFVAKLKDIYFDPHSQDLRLIDDSEFIISDVQTVIEYTSNGKSVDTIVYLMNMSGLEEEQKSPNKISLELYDYETQTSKQFNAQFELQDIPQDQMYCGKSLYSYPVIVSGVGESTLTGTPLDDLIFGLEENVIETAGNDCIVN